MSLTRSLVGSLRSRQSSTSADTHKNHTLYRKNTQSSIHTPPNAQDDHTPPVLARDVDLFASKADFISKDLISEQHVTIPHESFSAHHTHPMFYLPVVIRKNIYSYCFQEEYRKISLSPQFATKAIFPEGYFASPWVVLEPLMGALHSFSSLRHELMVYFWTEYQFHVTLTMFSGPKFSPLSSIWLMNYLDTIQHLTLEVDLTRFGCGVLESAPQFGYDYSKVRAKILEVVDGLLARKEGSQLCELNLLCRRYAGLRPVVSNETGMVLKISRSRIEY